MSNASCQNFLPLLSGFADGELEAGARREVEQHVSSCARCASRLADAAVVGQLLKSHVEAEVARVDFSRFADEVMLRIGPAPVSGWAKAADWMKERLRLPVWGWGLASAAAAALVTFLVMGDSREEASGYYTGRPTVQAISTDGNSRVAPLVIETENGDSIIWMVDEKSEGAGDGAKGDATDSKHEDEHPNGGEL